MDTADGAGSGPVVQAGIVAAGVHGFWNDVVIGVILIAVVVIHLWPKRAERFGGSCTNTR